MFWRREQARKASVTGSEIRALGANSDLASKAWEHKDAGQVDLALTGQPLSSPSQEKGVSPIPAVGEPARYVVPRGYVVEGECFVPGTIRLEGVLAGKGLVAQRVVVSHGGALKSASVARSFSVAGSVNSPIKARDAVEVLSGGHLSDEVESPSLQVDKGGSVFGSRLKIGPVEI